MDFSFKPSLKQRALVKTAVAIFSNHDLQILIPNDPYTSDDVQPGDVYSSIEFVKIKMKTVEDEALKYISKLPLTNALKDELLSFVHVVGWQLFRWKQGYQLQDYHDKKITKFHWTPQGTIDRKKTSELYLNDESISVYVRFTIACMECLEDYISTLWKKLQEPPHNKEIRNCKPPLISFWSRYMEGKLHLLSREIQIYRMCYNIPHGLSTYEYMFSYSVISCNLAATMFFFQKLTSEQKKELLGMYIKISAQEEDSLFIVSRPNSTNTLIQRVLDEESYADISAFLISNLNEEQQNVMLRKYPHFVLKCLLIWPRQTFFMQLAKSMFFCPPPISSDVTSEVEHDKVLDVQDFTREIQYYRVLKMIASKMLSNSVDYSYKKLFAKFWHESHYTYKKYVIDNFASDAKLSAAFKAVNIQPILKDVNISRKRKTSCD